MNRLEYIHNKFYIHRDVKPENFMSGRKEYKDVLYLIDYGLSKRYRDPKTGQHVKFVNNRRLNGTARYASIHALEGYETSRRDDLEGLSYVLVYFLNGRLPWERIKNRNKHERYKLILNMKKKITEENLVGDKNNTEFIEFVKYCRKLKFEERPNYDYLRGLMIECISKNNKSVDNFYNIDINKNPVFHQQDKKDKSKPDFNRNNNNNSLNISCKNTRCNSTKRLKISFGGEKIMTNENNDVNENNVIDVIDEYDGKILNESKSSTIVNIEKKVRNYSCFKNHGIKGIQHLDQIKKRYTSIKILNSTKLNNINKNMTSFRTPSHLLNDYNNNNNNNQNISHENKKHKRTRFNFIKRSLGIEQKKKEMITVNDSNPNVNTKKNISDINENNIHIYREDDDNKDSGCIII